MFGSFVVWVSIASAMKSNCTYSIVRGELDRLQSQCVPPYTIHNNAPNHGFAVDLVPIVRQFIKYGIKQNRPAKFHNRPWNYAKGVCEYNNMRCFFRPVLHELKCIPNQTTQISLDSVCDQNELVYYVLKYITEPLPTLLLAIQMLVETVDLKLPCAVIHLRRTDNLLNDGWDHKKLKYKWVPLSEYIELGGTDLNKMASVFLMTDDAAAINETKATPSIPWRYIQRKRFNGKSGGWENHFPSGNKVMEIVTILALRELTSRCSLFIGTNPSSFGRLMHSGMRSAPHRLVNIHV